jgi:hypothetical protein
MNLLEITDVSRSVITKTYDTVTRRALCLIEFGISKKIVFMLIKIYLRTVFKVLCEVEKQRGSSEINAKSGFVCYRINWNKDK